MARDFRETTSATLTVFYDGECPLCVREVAHYRKIDTAGRVEWRDVAADPRAGEPIGLSCDAAMARMHAVTFEGRVVSGADAFLEVWRRMPGVWPRLAKLAAVPPIHWMLERSYRVFARHRDRIASGVARLMGWREA